MEFIISDETEEDIGRVKPELFIDVMAAASDDDDDDDNNNNNNNNNNNASDGIRDGISRRNKHRRKEGEGVFLATPLASISPSIEDEEHHEEWGEEEQGTESGGLQTSEAESEQPDESPKEMLRRLSERVNVSMRSQGHAGSPAEPLRFQSQDIEDAVRVAAALSSLLAEERRSRASLEESSIVIRRLRGDVTRLRSERSALQGKVDSLQKECALQQERAASQERRWKREKMGMQKGMNEVQKRLIVLQQRESAFVARERKQEVEYDRLRRRIGKLMGSGKRGRGKKVGDADARMHLQGPVPSSSFSSSQPGLTSGLISMEERQMRLLKENAELREMYCELAQEVRQYHGDDGNGVYDEAEIIAQLQGLPSGWMMMEGGPIEKIREGIHCNKS
eukprot:g3619.t1